MRVALLKTPGISTAEVSLERAEADIALKPDNRLTIPQLRELLKKNGYPTKEARVSARGRLGLRDGRLVLDLLNGVILDVRADAKIAAEADALAHDASRPVVELTAVSKPSQGQAEDVTLLRLSPHPEPLHTH